MREEVYLFVESPPGYQPHPADGFGYRGIRPVLKRAGGVQVTLLAETSTATGCRPLDDGAGAVAADLVGSNDGVLFGAPVWCLDCDTSGEAGDHALQFDGFDDEMQMLPTVKDGFSISLWIRTLQTGPGGSQWYHGNGLATPAEAWNWMIDVDSGKHVINHGGSAGSNAYRDRWIMVFGEAFGSSLLGEIWYSEAAAPEGPWTKTRKIITHDDYSFYNVSYHPQFDQSGGRLIYLEGTYTASFSGNTDPTPRHDYNQVMYRLDLANPRLSPVK